MKVLIGSDHAGYELKGQIIAHLNGREGLEVRDFGTDSADVSCDYTDIALQVGRCVASGDADRGILVCGTGIGMSIAANKVPGVYAAVCWNKETATLSRQHNNANVLTLGGRMLEPKVAIEAVDTWLATDFEGGRHVRRTQKIRAYEGSTTRAFLNGGKGQVVIFDHPLIQHKLTILRDKKTPVMTFRGVVGEIAALMVYEITRDLPLKMIDVETPVAKTKAYVLAGKKLAVVPILRAGLGMMEGVLSVVPNAKVGHIGLYRDPATLEPVEYYCKLPADIGERDIFVVDPMLATGGSAAAAVTLIKKRGGKKISLVSLLAAPEGVSVVHNAHPDVNIFVAGLDSHLNEHGYIVPGLGDAGDRIFGTK